mmetsp:Transcript_1526/g.4843  ORF Transcript_1526/g.4843 Transcript_1526/m.4843 type:complete len:243 (-) Transcript_1526:1547-2275(-)
MEMTVAPSATRCLGDSLHSPRCTCFCAASSPHRHDCTVSSLEKRLMDASMRTTPTCVPGAGPTRTTGTSLAHTSTKSTSSVPPDNQTTSSTPSCRPAPLGEKRMGERPSCSARSDSTARSPCRPRRCLPLGRRPGDADSDAASLNVVHMWSDDAEEAESESAGSSGGEMADDADAENDEDEGAVGGGDVEPRAADEAVEAVERACEADVLLAVVDEVTEPWRADGRDIDVDFAPSSAGNCGG